MDIFNIAKKVRLHTHPNNYLYACEDEESVISLANHKVSSQNARWTVEFNNNKVLLKSCYGKYLTASHRTCCLMAGMTRLTVVQTEASGRNHPPDPESSLEWEPIKEAGELVKLKTHCGSFLRTNNGGILPWRNSITHGVPRRDGKQEKRMLWHVDVLEILPDKSRPEYVQVLTTHTTEYESDLESFGSGSSSTSNFTE